MYGWMYLHISTRIDFIISTMKGSPFIHDLFPTDALQWEHSQKIHSRDTSHF